MIWIKGFWGTPVNRVLHKKSIVRAPASHTGVPNKKLPGSPTSTAGAPDEL